MKTAAKRAFSEQIRVESPSLYFKVEQIAGEWITRQLAYMSKADVATLLHISERTVYELVTREENPLPYFKLPGGRALLFRPDLVESWVEQNQGAGL